MEGVEDIPGTALAEGISWGWESFPEHMELLDRMPHTIDFLAHVPHDALRVYVMGERAVHDEAATAEEIAEMRRPLRESPEAGAIGFRRAEVTTTGARPGRLVRAGVAGVS